MSTSLSLPKRVLACIVAFALALLTVPVTSFATVIAYADEDVVFTVYTQSGDDDPVVAKQFTKSELNKLAEDNAELSGGYMYGSGVVAATSYVTLDEIYEAAGVSFGSADTLVVGASDDSTYSFSYQDMNAAQYFYPAYTGGETYSTEGAVSVASPAIGISWGSAKYSEYTTAGAAYEAAKTTACDSGKLRFLIGQKSWEDTSNVNLSGKRMLTDITSITIQTPVSDTFTIYEQYGDDDPVEVKTYTAEELQALATDATFGALFYKNNAWQVVATSSYITIDKLLEDADVSFAAGDSLTPEADDGFGKTFSYEQLEAAKYFYPATTATQTSADGAYEIGAVLALNYVSTDAGIPDGQTAASTLASIVSDAGDSYRFLCGLSEDDYLSQTAAGNRFVTSPTSITVTHPASEGTAVYRLYNQVTSEHLYTTDENEYNSLPSQSGGDWIQESVAWQAPTTSDTMVYRLYNNVSGDHQYTTDENEVSVLTTGDWVVEEGAAFYSADETGTPVYRLYNSGLTRGQHHFTADANEYASLPVHGWVQEDIAWYGLAS